LKNVEIITTQNVVLQYELATLQDRIFAFLIDLFALGFGLSIVAGILGALAGAADSGATVVSFVIVLIFFLYSLILETFNDGQSLGKRALRIQVIKLAEGRATFSDYASRWAFRLVDIYFSFGAVATIMILSSSKGQRIGDMIANTAVVKMVPKTNIDLHDLLSIHQANKYVPKYLQARKLREEDALLIKATLERYGRFRNRAHAEAIDSLADHIRENLHIDADEESQPVFLRTILNDYVVLSR
jgi:uncharacterized RDD family membrane protein YckC